MSGSPRRSIGRATSWSTTSSGAGSTPGLTTRLTELHGWPVLLENDANLATFGEHWRGEARDVDDLVVLLAGERFGSGLMDSGRLLHGSRGGAGEMVYLKLVEGVGDTAGIARTAREQGAKAVADAAVKTSLRELADGKPVTAELVFAAAADGDKVALGILRLIACRTARVLATLGILFNPELIVIGGAVATAAKALLAGHRNPTGHLHRHPTPHCGLLARRHHRLRRSSPARSELRRAARPRPATDQRRAERLGESPAGCWGSGWRGPFGADQAVDLGVPPAAANQDCPAKDPFVGHADAFEDGC